MSPVSAQVTHRITVQVQPHPAVVIQTKLRALAFRRLAGRLGSLRLQLNKCCNCSFLYSFAPPEQVRVIVATHLVGSWHCDSHKSMCLTICFLTVLTASGDEQFEESPSILKGSWGHPLKSVPCPQLLHLIKYDGFSSDDFCFEAWRHGS